jgi:hypothetical protein
MCRRYWLEPVKQFNRPISRAVWVQRCVDDQWLLTFLGMDWSVACLSSRELCLIVDVIALWSMKHVATCGFVDICHFYDRRRGHAAGYWRT